MPSKRIRRTGSILPENNIHGSARKRLWGGTPAGFRRAFTGGSCGGCPKGGGLDCSYLPWGPLRTATPMRTFGANGRPRTGTNCSHDVPVRHSRLRCDRGHVLTRVGEPHPNICDSRSEGLEGCSFGSPSTRLRRPQLITSFALQNTIVRPDTHGVFLLQFLEEIFLILKECFARLLGRSPAGNSRLAVVRIPVMDAYAAPVLDDRVLLPASLVVCSKAPRLARAPSPLVRAGTGALRPLFEGRLKGRACQRLLWAKKSSLTLRMSRHV